MVEVLTTTQLGAPNWMWVTFVLFTLTLLLTDLLILSKHPPQQHRLTHRSLKLWLWYASGSLLFGLLLFKQWGSETATQYFTGLAVETTLSLDNIFLISLVFTQLSIPVAQQHRVLMYGVLGMIVLRTLLVMLGVTLITHFNWVLYAFAGMLLLSGLKLLKPQNPPDPPTQPPLLSWLQKHLPMTLELHGNRFLVPAHPPKGPVRWLATPLLLALIMVESTDILFAMDSIPAIFAITTNPFVVLTSNVFAVLGLRALYFTVAGMMHRFVHLKTALAAVQIFIGLKILYSQLIGKVDPFLSLGVILGLLGTGVLWSMLQTRTSPQLQHLPSSGQE